MYYVYSFYTAAFLVTKGFEIVKTEKDEGGKYRFYFDESEELYQELRKFRNNKFFKEFIKNINEMKKIIFSDGNKGENKE